MRGWRGVGQCVREGWFSEALGLPRSNSIITPHSPSNQNRGVEEAAGVEPATLVRSSTLAGWRLTVRLRFRFLFFLFSGHEPDSHCDFFDWRSYDDSEAVDL